MSNTYLEAAKAVLGPLVNDHRFGDVFGPTGDYLDIGAIARPESLSTGESALVRLAQALYTNRAVDGSSIAELSKLDRNTQARVLNAIIEFHELTGGVQP